jgi:hypothetical protein
LVFASAVFGLLVLAAPASANVLPDQFDAENGGAGTLNYTSFADFTVSSGSVDLIGNTYFDNFPGNGLYVDMAGSTGQFGALTTDTIYGPGTYHVTIGLGGSIYADIADGVNVNWGSGNWSSNNLAGLSTNTFEFDITLAGASAITIADLGNSGNPNIGATLFGITVEQTRAVPEPLTLSLLGAGLAGMGAIRRRKR